MFMHIGDVERWRALDDKMDSLLKRTKVKSLKKLADSGDVDSMFLYGCHELVTNYDPRVSESYLRSACENGSEQA